MDISIAKKWTFRIAILRTFYSALDSIIGNAILCENAATEGMDGSKVTDMLIRQADAPLNARAWLFAFPADEGRQYRRPAFLAHLLVLLDNLEET